MQSFLEYEERLSKLINRLNLPMTGITRSWLKSVVEIEHLTAMLLLEYGQQGVELIERQLATIRATGRCAWAIRQPLVDLARTIASVEADIRTFALEPEEVDHSFMTVDQSIGIWSWSPGDPIIIDNQCKKLFGLPEDVQPTFDLYLSAIPYENESKRLMEKAYACVSGAFEGYSDTHHILRRMDNSERLIFLRGHRHIVGEKTIVIGYVQDVTDPCVILCPQNAQTHAYRYNPTIQ